MKSFLVMTLYQLMNSVAMALNSKEKCNLYFHTNYIDVDETFLQRIRDTGVFNDVVGLDQQAFIAPFVEELKETKDMSQKEIDRIGNSIFERYLTPYYAEKFKDADFDDEIYVYNDFQWHFYYVGNHFNNIIGIEDGYKSLKQQLGVHRFKGNHQLVEPFLGDYYPEPLYKSKNIKKIISSCEFDDLPEYYEQKLEILDFKTVMEKNKPEFLKAMLYIFDLENLKIRDDSVLILGAPLARSKYCNAAQEHVLFRKLIREQFEENPESHIYIKPHPADILQHEMFADENVTVLSKTFPIELLEYRGDVFRKTISFGSTAVLDKLSDNNQTLYSGEVTIDGVKEYILSYIGNEKLKLNYYIKVDRIDDNLAANVFSYLNLNENFDIKLNILVREDIYEKCKKLLDLKNAKTVLKNYRKKRAKTKEGAFYDLALKKVQKTPVSVLEGYKCWNLIPVKSTDEDYLYKNYIRTDEYDYCMLVDSNNLGSYVMKKSTAAMQKDPVFMYSFLEYTYRTGASGMKVYTGAGKIENMHSNSILNKIIHKCVFEKAEVLANGMPDISKYTFDYPERMKFRAILKLYKDAEHYLAIENGEEYYSKKITDCITGLKNGNQEYICRLVALELYEYYNWIKIKKPRFIKGMMNGFICSLSISEEMKTNASTMMLEAILEERRIEEAQSVNNNAFVYEYSIRVINKIIKTGVVTKLHELAAVIRKVYGPLKQFIKRKKEK